MTIESVLHILLERLNLPEDEAPTQAQLEEEFDKYIAELQAEEDRLANLKSRYEALSDKGLIQGSLSISNPDLHFAELLQAEAEVAEEKMIEMEQAYHNFNLAINHNVDKLQQIAELESQITPRRYREAIVSGDHSFIEGIELQIEAIRATL